MTPSGLSDAARQRIQAMVATTDGFRLAEVDLQLRGPGEMAGTRQSGLPEFRVADLMGDSALLALAQREARALAQNHADCDRLIQIMSSRTRGESAAGLLTVG